MALSRRLYYAGPAFFESVKNVPDRFERARLFALLCRINTLYMIARAGSGHIGSSFSSIDIVSWLHLERMSDEDVYFSSKGHDAPGLYSVLIGLGKLPFEQLHSLRRRDGLPGHPDIHTPGIPTNTGSLGMGISKAKGMVLADRLKKRHRRVFVMTGDGELQEGQVWESLATAVSQRMNAITVIVDHNKLQSDTFVDNVSPLGELDKKFRAFGFDVRRCNGHDFASFNTSLEPTSDRPLVIIADTIKGQGVSFMEHTSLSEPNAMYQYHSGAPSEIDYEHGVAELSDELKPLCQRLNIEPISLEQVSIPGPVTEDRVPESIINAYATSLVREAEMNDQIVALDADLVLDVGLIPFRDRYPNRFFECGIAEQDMVSTAGSLARAGFLPIVHSFASFLTARANEQIYNNATQMGKIIYVGSLAGLIPGGPGHSHQATRDIALMGGVPGLVMIEPCNEEQTKAAVAFCISQTYASCYLRLCSVPFSLPVSPTPGPLVEGRGEIVLAGSNGVFLTAYGPVLLAEACRAADHLQRELGVAPTVVALPFLNCLDLTWSAEIGLTGAEHIVALDNHVSHGGQGAMLAMTLRGGPRVHVLAADGIPASGTQDEVLLAHRLDADSIGEALRPLLLQHHPN